MKLSVFTVSTPDLSPEQLLQAALEAGIDGIEWRYKGIPDEAKDEQPSFWRKNLCSIDPVQADEEVTEIRALTERYGLKSIALVPYLTSGDLAATEQAFSSAQKLGASMMRVGVPGYNRTIPYDDLYKGAVSYLNEVQELSRQYGVKALVETHHGTIAPSAGLAHRLVSSFDPQHIGVLYDPGNMVHEGYENYRMGLELLGPYLAHVHVKNAGWVQAAEQGSGLETHYQSQWSPLLDGAVRWSTVLTDLAAVGYDGYLGIEDFSKSFSSADMLKNFSTSMHALRNEVLSGGGVK
ncbi:sugar phosphate isomerase/epimerase [Neobacillus mesonae]|nr:sugar phosphate isomerase/epimerase [Neobacillus mesonae]